MVNSADDSCRKFEDKIINGMTPDYEALLSLHYAAKEGHDNARRLLDSLGIHQDGDSYKLTKVDEVQRMIIRERIAILKGLLVEAHAMLLACHQLEVELKLLKTRGASAGPGYSGSLTRYCSTTGNGFEIEKGEHPAQDGGRSIDCGGFCGQGNRTLTCDERCEESDEKLNFQLNESSSKKLSKIKGKFKNLLPLKIKKKGSK